MKTIKKAIQAILFNLKPILLFEVFYLACTTFIFMPLVKLLVTLTLMVSGTNYISNANLFRYATHPVTIVVFAFIIITMAMFIMLQISGTLVAINASHFKKKVQFGEMLRGGCAAATRVLSKKNWTILLFVLVILPFTDVIRVSDYLGKIEIPGFIMETIDSFWQLQLLLYALVLFLAWLCFRWFFGFQYFIFEKKTFKEGRKASEKLVKGKTVAILIRYFLASVVLSLGVLLLEIVLIVLLYFALSVLVGSSASFDISLFIGMAIMVFTSLISKLVLIPFNFAFMSEIFFERKEACQEEVVPYTPIPRATQTEKRLRQISIAVLVVTIGLNFYTTMINPLVDSSTFGKTPAVMAHRGDSVRAPENTLPAFQAAIDDGADAAEMDVQMTKDGVIVVLHDSSITRTTGVSKNIWEVTYDEIKDLDNGSFFDPSFSSTHIPTLAEVLELCAGKLTLNIEIKRTGHDEGIEEKVVALIQQYNYYNQCDITSMDYATVQKVKELDPMITTVYTTTVAYGSMDKLDAADTFSIEGTFVTADLVEHLHDLGKSVYVWTIDDEVNMDKFIEMDVDAIITNNPVLLQERIQAYNAMGNGVVDTLKEQLEGIVNGTQQISLQ